MNYDEIFDDNVNQEFYYNDDELNEDLFVNGYISLKNAKARLGKREYYALVHYNQGEELPDSYRCFSSSDGNLYATPKTNLSFDALIDGNSLQMIYKLNDNDDEYRLGPNGTDTIHLSDLAHNQLEQYNAMQKTSINR